MRQRPATIGESGASTARRIARRASGRVFVPAAVVAFGVPGLQAPLATAGADRDGAAQGA